VLCVVGGVDPVSLTTRSSTLRSPSYIGSSITSHLHHAFFLARSELVLSAKGDLIGGN